MNKRDYTSVSDMLAELDPELRDEFDDLARRRLLVKHLLVVRSAKGLSQQDVANRMECSQSKVSKIENSFDADLNVGDIEKYADAIGVDLCVGLTPKNQTAFDRIQRHAFGIKKELQVLAKFADVNDAAAKRIAESHLEVLMNLVRMVAESAASLPCPEGSGEPYLQIAMGLIDEDCEVEQGNCDSPLN